MKIFALVGSALAATVPSAKQWGGKNKQGGKWSASVNPDGVQYQENGFSLSAEAGDVTADTVGLSTYCPDDQEGCMTQQTQYHDYVWDSVAEVLSATGVDNVSKISFRPLTKTKLRVENSP